MIRSFLALAAATGLAAFTLVATGCSQNMARGIYEGKRTKDTIEQTPIERATQPIPSHEQYERERQKSSNY